ncbi:MAG: sugar transferase [Desulfitobacteriaceae bacterium]
MAVRGISGIVGELSITLDLALTFAGFYLAVLLYSLKGVLLEHIWPTYVFLFILYAFFGLIMASTQEVYQSRRFLSWGRELVHLTKAHFLTFAATLITINLADPDLIRNHFLFYFAGFVYGLTVGAHLVTRIVLQAWRRTGRNRRYILLLGSGPAAERYLNTVKSNPQLGYRIIGYLAPRKNGLPLPYLGRYEALEAVIQSNIVDLVVVTASLQDEGIRETLELLEIMGKNVAILLDEFISRLARSRTLEFGGLPMVAYDTFPRRSWHEIGKRLIDVLVSSIVLLVASPVMLAVALAVKLTSSGPVFFRQERVGINGRQFKMYKFRSMVVNAEELKEKLAHLNEMSGPVFKITNDPRVTPVGRFIRKTSLDELPQLWNVLKGDMSLVGPRPPVPEEVNLYDPKHRKRLAVRPGITCTWQISGRNAVDFEEWMAMDAEYVERWSLWLDMEILVKTVPVVLLRRGAS